MTQPTDEYVVRLGNLAESLLYHEGFNELYELITKAQAEFILATPLEDSKGREDAYLTYHGMRSFAQKLPAFVAAREATIERNDRINDTQEDD